MLKQCSDQLEVENSNLLKDALTSIIDVVVLDETTLQATVMYKVANITWDKLASPRGFEPRSPP
jgi:hypothetical protein